AQSLVPLLVPLFISSFRRADDLAMAMEARCYRGGENRTRMKALKWQPMDGFILFIIFAYLGVMIWLRMR
ncbi:MAG: energy-coupling factor transporter transmembrane component T, partial [Bacillota bacterium]|nr:energy-coupling factor transporter transmembrane component T [Bacillota bacterium]